MELNPREIYVQACADRLRAMYEAPVLIRITARADPSNYPFGAWFDNLVGAYLFPAGIDPDSIPPLYIMPNGDAIPTSCAELIQPSQIIMAFRDALMPVIQALQNWMNSISPEIRQALIDAGKQDTRKERHRRRYQRMMERGRRRR